MKTKYFSAFAALVMALTLTVACDKDKNGNQEEASIQVSPEQIEASWEGKIQEIEVTANCSWTISKTDAEGTAVDWVKCDRSNGKGSLKFNVKVEQNPLGEARSATVTIYAGDVKAFIDVQQEANPDPNPGPGPDPGPEYLTLEFDFTVAGLGWPTATTESWAALKNCDSGCATDNDGTATANPHRRAQVTYTLNGTGYDFTFADPNGAEKHNIYLHPENKGVYSGTLRYFGIPAIEGKKIVKIEMVQNASTKTVETFFRNVGVTPWVYHKDVAVTDIQYVSGGEVQNQNTNGETYTYELSGTYPNRVYWINSPTNASIIKSLKLYYADADGSEVAPGPEPADPTPTPPDDPGDDPTPIEPTLSLTFSFTGTPFEGWPTAAKYTHVDGGVECTYPLDGTNYIFVPADCDGASAGQAFWAPPVEAEGETPAKPGYFALNAQYRYLGLPKIEGYALCRVICHNVYLSTTAPKIGVTTLINGSAAHPSNDAYVKGGALQTWDANGGGTYTYNLFETAANTRYYIYAYAKAGIDTITLGYYPLSQ